MTKDSPCAGGLGNSWWHLGHAEHSRDSGGRACSAAASASVGARPSCSFCAAVRCSATAPLRTMTPSAASDSRCSTSVLPKSLMNAFRLSSLAFGSLRKRAQGCAPLGANV